MSNKALIVEDDPVAAKILENFLVNRGYDVVVATTAEDALETIEARLRLTTESNEKWFSLICLDIHLPHSDGISMLFTLRQLEEQHGRVGSEGARVIVITGDETLHTFHEASVLNAQDYLLKPIDQKKLEALIPQQ